MYQLVIVITIAVLATVVASRLSNSHIHLDGHTLRRSALLVMLIGAGFFTLFIVGEIMSSQGVGFGSMYVALFLTPLVVLSLLASSEPTLSRIALSFAVVSVIAFNFFTVFTFDSWRTFENIHGPIGSIAIVVVEIPLAIHACYRDTRIASYFLIYLGIVPSLLRAVAIGHLTLGQLQHFFTTSGFSPSLIVGAMLLWSTYLPEHAIQLKRASQPRHSSQPAHPLQPEHSSQSSTTAHA
jgi:hypothetical protein